MEIAAHGYDIWLADPWKVATGDPGVRRKIFDIRCLDENSEEGYYGFFQLYPEYSCMKKFKTETFKTFKDYMDAVGSTNTYSEGTEASVEGGAFGVSLSISGKYEQSGNSEQNKIKKLFQEKQGEILLAKAVCKTYDVQINTDYTRPMFTTNFVDGLLVLNNGLSEPVSKQENLVKNFIKNFGTHIMAEVDFGAMMLYEKRFASRSKNEETSEKRNKCVSEAANNCIEAGYEGSTVTAKAKACKNSDNKDCSDTEFNHKWGSSNSLSSSSTFTLGSPLSSDTEWGTEDNFHPVPIGYIIYQTNK